MIWSCPLKKLDEQGPNKSKQILLPDCQVITVMRWAYDINIITSEATYGSSKNSTLISTPLTLVQHNFCS
jgi:hypothetical protein